MFDLTRKQFLKRSSKCLDDIGLHSLLISELIDSETNKTINNEDAYKQIRTVMQSIGEVFSNYQKLNPPSEFVSMHLSILNSIILLQESTTAIYDYINMVINQEDIREAQETLEKSRVELDKFRTSFRPLTAEVDKLLNQYKPEKKKN